MSAVYEGKTVQKWIAELQSGEVVERCAAAMALADFDPKIPPAHPALLGAINDTDIRVQVAARVALGLVQVKEENRQGMIRGLLTGDDFTRHSILGSLAWLASPEAVAESKAPAPEERIVSAAKLPESPMPRASTSSPAPAAPEQSEPDIALVHVFPWWFLAGAVALCVVLAWVLRGVPWSKWALLGPGAAALLYLMFSWHRLDTGAITRKHLRSRARLAFSIVFASLCGFGIGLFFPAGAILIDNESGIPVRLLIDGEEWLTIQTGESKKKAIASGTYRLTVQSLEGNRALDDLNIEVAAYRQHVLNVLGAQAYFEGEVVYGGKGGSTKMHAQKWFQVPEVDYVFREPPKSMNLKVVNGNWQPLTKTFILKAAPPKDKGG